MGRLQSSPKAELEAEAPARRPRGASRSRNGMRRLIHRVQSIILFVPVELLIIARRRTYRKANEAWLGANSHSHGPLETPVHVALKAAR